MGFSVIDYVIFGIYIVGTVLIGLYFAGKATNSDDYVVANRSLGLSVLIATFVATSVGGGTLTGWVGEVYRSGVVVLPTMIVLYIIGIVMALFFAKKLRHFAGYTAPEIMGRSYGRVSQALGGVCSMVYLIGTGPALQALALGSVFNIILGLPLRTSAVLAMCIIIFYTCCSGMWGVAMTDYFQFVVMAVGVGVASIIALNDAGGWSAIVAATPVDHFSVDADPARMIELIAALALPVLIDGNRYQRFYAAKDEKTAVYGGLIAVLPWHLIYMLIICLGFSAYVLLGNTYTPDQVFPAMLMKVLPLGIKGIVFASLVAAIMSTADSYMLVAATNFVHDIYHPLFRPNASDKELIKITRIAVVCIGLIGLAVAFWVPSIMGVWTLASTAYVCGCFVPMLYALFCKGRKSPIAAVASILLGGGIGIYLKLADITYIGQPAIVIGTICSLLIFTVVTLLDKNSRSV